MEQKILGGLLAADEKGEHTKRVQKRIELIEKEIAGMSEGAADESKPEAKGETKPEPLVNKPHEAQRVVDVKRIRDESKQAEVDVEVKKENEEEKKGESPTHPALAKRKTKLELDKVDTQSFAIVQQRWQEYRDAVLYLQGVLSVVRLEEVGEKAMQEKLMSEYDVLDQALDLSKRGKTVDVLKLPPQICPEHVIGCGPQERVESPMLALTVS